jgi:hypothetical protein
VHGTFFDIGLGVGLAAACGLRPFLPLLLAGALASAKALDVSFPAGSYHFLQASWWLLVVAVALALAYGAQLLLALPPVIDGESRQPRREWLAAALAGLSVGAGALLFAATLGAHGEITWPGAVAGIAVAGLAQRVATAVIAGARRRLPDRGAREALTVYLDAAALLAAVLVALLHPLGYVLVAALLSFEIRRRSRAGEKYAGLRILGR